MFVLIPFLVKLTVDIFQTRHLYYVLRHEALKEIISDMGKPKQIQSDKGNEFMGVFKKHCGDNGIELNMSDKDGKLKNSIAERFNRTLIGYIKRYTTAYPRAGILQLKAVLPDFISNYNDSIHRMIGIEPQLAFDTDMIYKNRKGLTMTQRDNVFFKVGDMVRVRKPRDIYTKGREAIYSKDVFKIVGSKGNVYTLSAPYEGQLEWSYNSLLKIKSLPEEEKEKIKVRVKVKEKDISVIKPGKPVIALRKPSARIAENLGS